MASLLRALSSGHRRRSLLARARDEPELFAEFYAEHYEQVLGFFARRTLDPDLAFDLMAETFAVAFAGLPTFRGNSDGEAHAWLWAIARSQLSAWHRRGQVSREAMQRLGIDRVPLTDSEFEHVEELADLERLRPQIEAALDMLSEDQRQAVWLRVVEERSYEEVAVEMNVSHQTARARVSRGLRTLGALLDSAAGESLVEEPDPRPTSS